jgi:hypothetical protein
MPIASTKKSTEQVAKFADMLSAMGTEPRLRIMQLPLSAHPDGLVVGDIQSEQDIPNSTLSHHLGKLKNDELRNVCRESTFLRARPTRKHFRSCGNSSTPNAALEIDQLNPKISSSFVDRRSHHEYHGHQGSSRRKVWSGSLAREELAIVAADEMGK